MSDRSALTGLKVIDAATLFAGPLAATFLADFGAEVIKIEHPKGGDPSRHHGHAKDGVGLWWKLLGRNKRAITLYLGSPEGQELFLRLVADADVVIENFRPGTLERWNLDYDRLSQINPRLVLARVTGFGQFGPMARRPGFGTLAESMSGFAHASGQPDGPPTLPPFALADGIAALATAFAVMTALRAREASGRGQVIDLAIIEPILTVLGPQPLVYDQLGIIPGRTGNRSVNNAPRNAYQTNEGKWVAISTSTQSTADRTMRLVGHPEFLDEPWFASGRTRAEHADELDAAVAEWISRHSTQEVVEAFEAAEAAVAPIYDVADVMNDEQFRALGTIKQLDDSELGTIRMQNVLFRLSENPGEIRWAGPPLGWHNEEVFGELGLTPQEMAGLRSKGVI